MVGAVASRAPGRPRAFDKGSVLNRAIRAFSASGYTGAAISELTDATGLTVGSIYKAFGDKEGLFAEALERYVALREAEIATLLEDAESGRARIAALLYLYANLSQGSDGKLGCLMLAGIADLPNLTRAAEILRRQLARRRALLSDLVRQGQRDCSIASTIAPGTVADLLLTLLYGMRLLGKASAFSDDPDGFVASALKILD